MEDALSLDSAGQAALLDRACADDPELRLEIERLLRLNDQMSTEFMPQPATPAAAIGPYHLLQIIGEGGMGEVWLAEQKLPVRRRVALKLIKIGMDTREVIARFESERQALALMDHPAIAKVFDAGSTSQGRPYFAMEYVPGLSITSYCDKHKVNIRERLELFRRVCEGVQHAHQKAIIHRDLKPSNILVTEVDGRPVPKIIDFGVAKALSQRLTAETMFTQLGAIVGTPEYMSPEQAESTGQDIDTRTDVYSLGVVLYEMLTGALPLDYRKLAFHEVLRKLREEDAPRPSTKLRTLGEESVTVAKSRRTEPGTLSRQLRGDLDSITLKALEKDRVHRYGAPSDLAADIERYLRNEPVVASRAGVGYRAKKYLVRHRVGAFITAFFVLLLLGFTILEAVQIGRITRERDRAGREAKFLEDMFRVRGTTRGINEIPVSEILDNGRRTIGELKNDPQLYAQMTQVMGMFYAHLGASGPAELFFAEARDTERQIFGPESHYTLESASDLAYAGFLSGRLSEAEKMLRETLSTQQRVLGPNNRDTLASTYRLAYILWREQRLSEARKLTEAALNRERQSFGIQDPLTLNSMRSLAEILDEEGDHAEAETLVREGLEAERRTLGLEDASTLNSMLFLARLLDRKGQHHEAEEIVRDAVDIEQKIPGTDNFVRFTARRLLFHFLEEEGKYAEAETVGRETVEIARRLDRPVVPVADILYNLACVAARNREPNEALSYLRESIGEGFSDLPYMEKDPDLVSLHGDPRFTALVKNDHGRVAAIPSRPK
jgi:non-specific serine/threonine protein kinase/serine/threonine-protein kinase